MDVKEYYTSLMDRAHETAGYTLEKVGKTAAVLDWAREFDVMIDDGKGGKCIITLYTIPQIINRILN